MSGCLFKDTLLLLLVLFCWLQYTVLGGGRILLPPQFCSSSLRLRFGSRIMEEGPHWERESQRLSLKVLQHYSDVLVVLVLVALWLHNPFNGGWITLGQCKQSFFFHGKRKNLHSYSEGLRPPTTHTFVDQLFSANCWFSLPLLLWIFIHLVFMSFFSVEVIITVNKSQPSPSLRANYS